MLLPAVVLAILIFMSAFTATIFIYIFKYFTIMCSREWGGNGQRTVTVYLGWMTIKCVAFSPLLPGIWSFSLNDIMGHFGANSWS